MRRVRLGALAIVLSLCACEHARRPRDCGKLDREQCLWERAQRQGAPGTAGEDGAASGDDDGAGWESEGSWSRIEHMLEQAAEWLSQGLGGQIMSEQAQKWCSMPPTPVDKGHGPAWICTVEDPPRIANREFTLEAGPSGELGLAARDLSGAESASVVETARRRWSSWCADDRFTTIERFQDEEFQGCALPDGPMLVVGRFPQDLEADLWQVSLTVMGAG